MTPTTLTGTLLAASLLTLAAASTPPEQCGWGLPRSPLQYLPLCLDDTAGPDPSIWAPWTHKPFCVEAHETPWCVYTNAAVPRANGKRRGISIVTTPALAADVLDLTRHPLGAAFDAIPPEKKFDALPYEVRDVPGKGKGAVATRKIEKGRVVLIDHVMVLATAEFPADVMHEEVQDLLSRGVEQLSESGSVYGLAQKGREEQGLTEVEDVLLTNSFEIAVADQPYMWIFPDLSRLNHACSSNAIMHFSETTLAMTVWSSRDIEPGEEITITYSDADMTYAERKKTFSEVWGFDCTCNLCTASEERRNASDARRLKIHMLRERVLKRAKEGDFKRAIKATEELFQVADEEGLTPHMGDLYEIPARLYYQIGDLEKAREYTKRSLYQVEGLGVPGGKDIERVEVLKGVLSRIENEMGEVSEGAEENK
ncbi:hypothetical protein B0T25DRAFT_609423 [Lasiosphaeria hispida]|uniref:SET domain-containing protein n=1 Tax=Lasiosphaeria hispida TaxID=260671 RepID=A0AAJ0MC05_9PEZI|nr:hypothetical protein B0T25DRAFT_609423 [Lasiosphaeria hispida]